MKKKKINADAALLEVARRHHTTVEEVRKEIRLAMIAAMCNPDPAVQKRWQIDQANIQDRSRAVQ